MTALRKDQYRKLVGKIRLLPVYKLAKSVHPAMTNRNGKLYAVSIPEAATASVGSTTAKKHMEESTPAVLLPGEN